MTTLWLAPRVPRWSQVRDKTAFHNSNHTRPSSLTSVVSNVQIPAAEIQIQLAQTLLTPLALSPKVEEHLDLALCPVSSQQSAFLLAAEVIFDSSVFFFLSLRDWWNMEHVVQISRPTYIQQGDCVCVFILQLKGGKCGRGWPPMYKAEFKETTHKVETV